MNRRLILFLGPCAKLDRKTGALFAPFSQSSRSGRFLRDLLHERTPIGMQVGFDNVMQTAFFDGEGRERNPTPSQLVEPLLTHRLWQEADTVIALSAAVRDAFELVASRVSGDASARRPVLHFLEHPSYIMRRPQEEREAYADRIEKLLGAEA